MHGGGIYKRKNKKTENYTRVGRLEKHVQRLQEKITLILFGKQSNWYLYSYKVGKMLANLPHHSATLQGYTTELHTFNIQELTTGIDK